MATDLEIKKVLYKEKPEAILVHIDKEGIKYKCESSLGVITFTVKFEEIGDAKFREKMESQHLNRWIDKQK